MSRLIAVACGATKALPVEPPQSLPPKLPAKDLYVGPLFRKRRIYAERCVHRGDAIDWCVLSALHGVLQPDWPRPACQANMACGVEHELRKIFGSTTLAKLLGNV